MAIANPLKVLYDGSGNAGGIAELQAGDTLPPATLPPATAVAVGVVKPGANMTVAADGTLTAAVATSSAVGAVKPGTNLTVAADGTLNATGGGLADFTDTLNATSPNTPTPVAALVATNAATNVDVSIVPKGFGALLAATPDGTAVGGNKRGNNAVDWSTARNSQTQVANGSAAVIGGGSRNTANNTNATVAGGYSNTASGGYAAVGGGNSNSATGSYSTIGGGNTNSVTAGYSVVAGGAINSATGTSYNTVGGGSGNTANSSFSTVPGGQNNTAGGSYTVAMGYYANATPQGKVALANGRFALTGDAQSGKVVLRAQTTSATPAVITADQASASAINQVVLPNDTTFAFRGQVVARNTANDADSKVWEFKGAIRRGVAAANTALIGTPSLDLIASDGSAWTVALTADTTNGGLTISATGEASKTINWVATVWTTEVTG